MSAKQLILFITLPLFIIDQISKWWIVMNFVPPRDIPIPSNAADLQYHITVIEGFLNIIRVHNTGVAFGMGNGTSWAPFVFLAVPLIAITVITVMWKKGVFVGWTGKLGFALLLSGIFGNLADRLTQGFALEHLANEPFWTRLMNGYVVDFIDVILPWYGRWPTFNVADSCICVAAVLMVICSWREDHTAA